MLFNTLLNSIYLCYYCLFFIFIVSYDPYDVKAWNTVPWAYNNQLIQLGPYQVTFNNINVSKCFQKSWIVVYCNGEVAISDM